MGQKVNPHGLRVGVIKNWDSRWFVSDKQFGDIELYHSQKEKDLPTEGQQLELF